MQRHKYETHSDFLRARTPFCSTTILGFICMHTLASRSIRNLIRISHRERIRFKKTHAQNTHHDTYTFGMHTIHVQYMHVLQLVHACTRVRERTMHTIQLQMQRARTLQYEYYTSGTHAYIIHTHVSLKHTRVHQALEKKTSQGTECNSQRRHLLGTVHFISASCDALYLWRARTYFA